jgi:Tat protein secretion system quality control protein TatD with DNase activity
VEVSPGSRHALIDTHCHLDVAAFAADRDAVVARASAAGVVGIVVPAIRPRAWDAVRAVVARHAAAGVRGAYGVHPQIVPQLTADERGGDLVERLAAAAAAACAIGECGLDGATGEHELQEQILSRPRPRRAADRQAARRPRPARARRGAADPARGWPGDRRPP